jgi:hypothetical protein
MSGDDRKIVAAIHYTKVEYACQTVTPAENLVMALDPDLNDRQNRGIYRSAGMNPYLTPKQERESYRLACRIIDKSDPERSIEQLERIGKGRLKWILDWIDAVKFYRPKEGEKVRIKAGHGQQTLPAGAIVIAIRFTQDEHCVVEFGGMKFCVSILGLEPI